VVRVVGLQGPVIIAASLALLVTGAALVRPYPRMITGAAP
jgi:hypothetical protein